MARTTQYVSAMISLLVATSAYADAVTNGLNGINIPSIGLDGSGIDIGQIEKNRPGDPSFDTTSPSLYHSAVNPFQVFFRSPGSPSTFDAHANIAAEVGAGGHPVEVAGILISTDTTLKGVAPGAHLYSIGDNATGPNFDPQTAESLQYLITRPGTDIRVVNMSLLNPPLLSPPNPFDGHELLSQFVDWSSRANGKDILYLIAHPQGVMAPNVIPSDNYNGMTIVYSEPVSGVWSRVGSGNNYTKDANGDRTSPALMAPGAGYSVPTWGTSALSIQFPGFTSYATAQASGAATLLQQFAVRQINASIARWDADARRHEVIKAVLMNSADKLIDNGTLAPQGALLGMTRTATDQQGNNWLQSEAYNDRVGEGGGATPLDDQMGAGHLNVTRSVQQFTPGKYAANSGDVPAIGWDYGHTTGALNINKYPIAGILSADNFISITLAWDRQVIFMNDGGTSDVYNVGDTFRHSDVTFPTSDSDDLINNMDMFLLPKGAATLSQAIAESITGEGTLQHIFFQLQAAGEYEIWVRQFDQVETGIGLTTSQDYALAWWYGVAPPLVVQGDYNGDQVVNAHDYNVWRSGFGTNITAGTGADGSGNGVIDAADYVIWRKNLSAGSGSALASVPEPSGPILLIAAAVNLAGLLRRERRFR